MSNQSIYLKPTSLVAGFPQPQYRWLKDGDYISGFSSEHFYKVQTNIIIIVIGPLKLELSEHFHKVHTTIIDISINAVKTHSIFICAILHRSRVW